MNIHQTIEAAVERKVDVKEAGQLLEAAVEVSEIMFCKPISDLDLPELMECVRMVEFGG